MFLGTLTHGCKKLRDRWTVQSKNKNQSQEGNVVTSVFLIAQGFSQSYRQTFSPMQ